MLSSPKRDWLKVYIITVSLTQGHSSADVYYVWCISPASKLFVYSMLQRYVLINHVLVQRWGEARGGCRMFLREPGGGPDESSRGRKHSVARQNNRLFSAPPKHSVALFLLCSSPEQNENSIGLFRAFSTNLSWHCGRGWQSNICRCDVQHFYDTHQNPKLSSQI